MEATVVVEFQPGHEHVGPHFGEITMCTEGNIVVVNTAANVGLPTGNTFVESGGFEANA
jgi:hypothetical protein